MTTEQIANITPAQFTRFTHDLKRMAGATEPTTFELIRETMYVYGSELATLRILMQYRMNKKASQGYSKNLDTWYFSFDLFETQ